MPGVQFNNQLDLNGYKVTELAPGTAPDDAVNVSQLTAASPRGFKQTVGDGTALTYTVTHNLATLDVQVQVYRLSDGATVFVDVARPGTNAVTVTFGTAPAANSYRVLVIPAP